MLRSGDPAVLFTRLGEQQEPVFDFTEELRRAIQHAPVQAGIEDGQATVEHLEHIQEEGSEYADRPDSHLIHCGGLPDPHEVVTSNPVAYPHLVEQAFAVATGEPLLGDPTLAVMAGAAAAHELEHAAALAQLDPRMPIKYGVGFVHVVEAGSESIPSVAPYMHAVGWLRKIDLAVMTVAPSVLSPGDIITIQSLGYDSPEEVRERYVPMSSKERVAINSLNAVYKGFLRLREPFL